VCRLRVIVATPERVLPVGGERVVAVVAALLGVDPVVIVPVVGGSVLTAVRGHVL